MIPQHHPPFGQVVRQPDDRQGPRREPFGDRPRTDAQLCTVSLTCRVSNSSTLVSPRVTARQDRRRDPFDDVADVAAGTAPSSSAVKRRRHRAAAVVAEHDDQRHVEHSDRVLDRAEHAESMTWPAVRTTNMSPRPWSKMISAATRLSEQPNTTAVGCCPPDRLARSLDALAGVFGLAGSEPLVTLFECFPCGRWAGYSGMTDIVPATARLV